MNQFKVVPGLPVAAKETVPDPHLVAAVVEVIEFAKLIRTGVEVAEAPPLVQVTKHLYHTAATGITVKVLLVAPATFT